MTLVSVLLPVRNGASYLEASMRSVLRQTHADLEVLVLDDASTDGSARLAMGLDDARVRVISSPSQMGLAATLNRGLEIARGEFVARQDADDLSHPARIERQIRHFAANPQTVLVGCQAWIIDAEDRRHGVITHACDHESLVWELLFDNAFVHSSVTFRRDAVRALGGYDPTWPYNQDFDLWIRLSRMGRVANLPERFVAWRTHASSMTNAMTEESRVANRRLIARSLRENLHETSESAASLAARAREGMELDELRAFLPLFTNWATIYESSLHRSARPGLRRTLGRQYANLTRYHFEARRLAMVARAGWRVEGQILRALFDLVAEKRSVAGHPTVSDEFR